METDKSFQIARFLANGLDPESGKPLTDLPESSPRVASRGEKKESTQSEDKETVKDELEQAIAIIRAFAETPSTQGWVQPPGVPFTAEQSRDILQALCIVAMKGMLGSKQTDDRVLQFPSLDSIASRGKESLEDFLNEIEKREILRALEETRYNRTQAARRLGITFRSMRYRIERLGLMQDDPRE